MRKTIRRFYLRQVRADARLLKKAYAAAMRDKARTPAGEWLCDNAYLLERTAEEVRTALRTAVSSADLRTAANACEAVYETGTACTQQAMTEAFSAHTLSSMQLQVLPAMLRAVILHKAAGDVRNVQVISRAIRTLRSLPDVDFDVLTAALSPVEKLLMQDPSGVYAHMEDESRAMYRGWILTHCARRKLDADDYTQKVLEKAQNGTDERTRHVGTYILPKPPKKRGTAFLVLEAVCPLLLAVLCGFWTKRLFVPFLLYFPLWEITAGFCMRLSQHGVPSIRLPRMAFHTVPQAQQTLLTVSALLPPAARTETLRAHLEQLYVSNGQANVRVCLLADLRNSGTPERPEDPADIQAADKLFRSLNEKYGGGFILAIRPRMYAPTEGYYSGWERKRGAITQLVREIHGESGGFLHLSGDIETLRQTKYLLALDSDTDLPMDAAAELVAVAAHPLHRAVVDEKRGIVTKGYGVLAPRVCTDAAARNTKFQRLMCADCGLSVYDNVVTERYQDLFGEGIFAGKGLIDADAFYKTLDHSLPTGRVLSHDSLESGFLRCGFVSDVQASDGFPKNQRVYFDRMSRWVRGDWQNLRFIFGKNPLTALTRWKLFDNLRRSLTPVICLAALFVCIFLPVKTAALLGAVCVLAAAGDSFAGAFRAVLHRGPGVLSGVFYSGTLPAALGDLLRGFVRMMQLPVHALKNAIAIVLALYRSTVSKKRLLDWTTFAQADASGSRRQTRADCLWIAAVSAALFVSPSAVLKLIALLFLADIPFLLYSGKPDAPQSAQLSFTEREQLTSYAAAMWKYFEDNCDFRNSYLPPDNVQETPVYRVAHRTSPTNIGLMLLCILTARDFGFIDSAQLCTRLQNAIASVERLETDHGNLLNWYDTETLKPLSPKYVSTVDCGNFLCCLKVLQQGIAEYAAEAPGLSALAERIQALEDKADLSVLYNPQRRLFRIGMDPESGKASDSYYDLLMSEARMTGYYAAAKRIVPKKHWAALSRTMMKAGRYMGPASWTGTTFEYFMPYLFLPAPTGTLGFEALKFCAWCQKKRVRGDRPYGISESGFYAFDRSFNYQYKAHGVQNLGLRRGLNAETVVSPYSSFLMMQMEPKSAMHNLKKLEQMQMTGRWGFYEAVDFTQSRTSGRPYAVVRSYMAHHIGMSLLAVSNVLQDGILRRRFLRDTEMRTAQSLLMEGMPTDAHVFKNKAVREPPLPREHVEPHRRIFADASPLAPNAAVYTNGELSLCASDVGASAVLYRTVSLFRHSTDLLRRPQGMAVVLQGEDAALPFAPMVDYSADAAFQCTFSANEVQYTAVRKGITLRVRVRVHPELSALQYTVQVRSARKKAFRGSVLLYAEPSLTGHVQAQAHPAFAKLFLEDSFDPAHRMFLFRKRERNGEQGTCMAAGFLKETDFTCTRAKESVLQTGYGLASLLRGNVQITEQAGSGDCCMGVQIPVQLAGKGSCEHVFLVTVASTRQEAVQKLLRLRETGGVREHKGAGGLFPDGRMESVLTEKLLPGTVFGVRPLPGKALAKRTLWQFGVSGTNPIVFTRVSDAEDAASAIPFIRAVHRLNRIGIGSDLLIGYTEGGEYDSPLLHAIRETVRRECGEADHIFPINLQGVPAEDVAALEEMSVFRLSAQALQSGNAAPKQRMTVVADVEAAAKSVKLYSLTDSQVHVPKTVDIPYIPWSFVLSNPTFGTMVSDKAMGFTWAINAHENKLTPWDNDVGTDNRGELLLLRLDGRYYDLLRAASAQFSPDAVQWEGVVQNVRYTVRVTVPERGMVKRCTVELHGENVSAELIYYTEPVLGSEKSGSLQWETAEDGLFLSSGDAQIRGYAYLAAQGGADTVQTDRAKFFCGETASSTGGFCAAVGKTVDLQGKTEQSVTFFLSFGKTKHAAAAICTVPTLPVERENYIRVYSADADFDRIVNTWLPWQVRKCRIEGRTGFYQCGGAWGFRDQLQDASAFLLTDPVLVRRQLLRCAAVQFREGDVLHWWHRFPLEDGGLRGVRTRYRDDLLWLPWLTAAYISATGDRGILQVPVPYLDGEPLTDNENERYFSPQRSTLREPLLSHCTRAVEYALQTGEHGLLLIGGGDWNDGFNTVGLAGKGESVWLTEFMICVLRAFAPFCAPETAERYRQTADILAEAVEAQAWDGDRYIRAFTDDGTPLGKADDRQPQECQIDSIAQSFACFADLYHAQTALETAAASLIDREKGLIRLLTPPFTGDGKQVGYITAYPPGIRENGGQYTHAAVWLCMAMLRLGRAEEGYTLFKMLNPAHFCSDPEKCTRYGGEPYAVAGDIPDTQRQKRCTGWSLYTGSAAWMYRTAAEEILGLHAEHSDAPQLVLKPQISDKLLPIRLEIRLNGTKINAKIENKVPKTMTEHGKSVSGIPLDGGTHDVVLR